MTNKPGSESLALGCAFPLEKGGLQAGQTVLDLGCGWGSEVLAAARLVGSEGFVYGLDMTPERLESAAQTAEREGLTNVAFIEGFIEDIPLANQSIDVVISNCVINLSDNRLRSLAEAARVLKQGGRLVIADIVLLVPAVTPKEQQLIAPVLGCVNGVLNRTDYLSMLKDCGFIHEKIEPYLRYTTDRLRSRAEKREATEVLAALHDQDFAKRLNGAFASVYVTANRPFSGVERGEPVGS